jgi:hypothetical protein
MRKALVNPRQAFAPSSTWSVPVMRALGQNGQVLGGGAPASVADPLTFVGSAP